MGAPGLSGSPNLIQINTDGTFFLAAHFPSFQNWLQATGPASWLQLGRFKLERVFMAAWAYLPILKWKQGERIALRSLKPDQRENVVPLIELQPITAAPDRASLVAALPAYLQKIAAELSKALPEASWCGIDTRYVAAGYPRQVQLLNAICVQLSKLTDLEILPVISSALVQTEPDQLAKLAERFNEHILRIDTPSVAVAQVQPIVDCAREHIPGSLLHVVVDQFSLVGKDPKVTTNIVKPYLDAAIASQCASVTLAGGSFPVNLIGFKQGFHDIVRVEWKVWSSIHKLADYADVRYSDYCVTHPAQAPEMDPTQVNPSVAIRYAADGFWRLFKAGGFKKGAPNQYISLCKLLMTDAVYSGATYSFGDKCYADAAASKLGNGNPSSWRRDATNHHLVLTQRSL